MIEKKDTHSELLTRYLNGDASPEEGKTLLTWLTDPGTQEEKKLYDRQKWEDAAGKKLSVDVQRHMFYQVKKMINRQRKGKTEKIYAFNRWRSYAAAVFLCVAVGIGMRLFYRYAPSPPVSNTFVMLADKGQRAGMILPDGTRVWLNSHTRLTYEATYGMEERIVALSGEAYFEVAKDKKRRFVVKAGKMEVEALGTAFNVKAYDEDEETTTTLFEGSVRAIAGKEAAILSPDQSAIFNKVSRRLSVNRLGNASYATLWRTNELAFSGESLEEIAVLLNRMYNVQIRFLSEKIKKHRFSGVIRNNSLENVFELISLTAPITYQFAGDTIYLNKR